MFGSRQQGHQGRFADFELESLGGRNPGKDGVELHQSPGPRTVREQRGPGAETTRHRSQGGMGKREKEKRLLVRPSASRSPPAPGGCWTPRHAARPRCTDALCCPHTGPGPAPPAPARASRPHRPPAPAAPVHAARAPRQPAPARPLQRARRKARWLFAIEPSLCDH